MNYMIEAIEEAKKGIHSNEGGPFGCIIVKDGKIIASAHNTVVKDNDPTAHGEINAIRKAGKALGTFNLNGCELYTTGEPCPMCLGAVMWANIDKVIYGCSSADINGIGFRDDKLYDAVKNGVDFLSQENRKECLELFDEYKTLNATNY